MECIFKVYEKMEKEVMKTCSEYDERFSIHYKCREWLEVLLSLLKRSSEKEKYKEVREYAKVINA